MNTDVERAGGFKYISWNILEYSSLSCNKVHFAISMTLSYVTKVARCYRVFNIKLRLSNAGESNNTKFVTRLAALSLAQQMCSRNPSIQSLDSEALLSHACACSHSSPRVTGPCVWLSDK
jgi:hypothetical protein